MARGSNKTGSTKSSTKTKRVAKTTASSKTKAKTKSTASKTTARKTTTKATAAKGTAAKSTAAKTAPAKKPAKKTTGAASKKASAPKVNSKGTAAKSDATTPKKSMRDAVKGTPTRPGKPKTRMTARAPDGAEELKAKIGELMTATGRIRSLKRGLNNHFYDIGEILHDIEEKRLYEAKGYSSFEAFVDREVDLGKKQSLQVLRISQTFVREAAMEAGLERATDAIMALDGKFLDSRTQIPRGPAVPFHKQ